MLVRAGIVTFLLDEGFDVVAEVGDAPSLVDAVAQHEPDLVVTDVRMPPDHRDDGLLAATAIRQAHPGVAVLVLSQHIEVSGAAALLGQHPTGVGYLLKERISHLAEFAEACRAVAAGGVVIDQLVTDRLMEGQRADDLSRLSAREREVLALMAQGRSNAAIAREVHCSAKTLETYIRSVFTKLGLHEDPDDHRRVAAVVKYLDARR